MAAVLNAAVFLVSDVDSLAPSECRDDLLLREHGWSPGSRSDTVSRLSSVPSVQRDSSVEVATGWTARVRLLARERDCYVLHGAQTDSGAHPPIYPVKYWGHFHQG
jgi:hypothetical protein